MFTISSKRKPAPDVSDASRREAVAIIATCTLVFVTCAIWYLTIHRFLFYGDDLHILWSNTHGGYGHSILASLGDNSPEKYRPLLTLWIGSELRTFGPNHAAYEYVNILVESVCAVVVTLFVWRISGRDWLTAATAGLIFVFNRFAYFNTVNVYGPQESLPLIALLASIWFCFEAFTRRNSAFLIGANLAFAIAIYLDERYIVACIIVAIIPLFLAKHTTRLRVIAWAVFPIAVVVTNVAIKDLLHQEFLMGTGGQAIGFEPGQFASFLFAGIANLLGFNVGPDYLSALDISKTHGLGYIFGLVFCGIVVALAFNARDIRFAREQVGALVFLAIAALLPFLISAAITIRLEFRWLTVCDALLIIMLSILLHNVRNANGRAFFGVSLVAITIITTAYYRAYLPNTYFFGATEMVRQAVKQMIHDGEFAPNKTYIVDNKTGSHWVLQDGDFLSVYGNATPNQVIFEDQVADVPKGADAFVYVARTGGLDLLRRPVNSARHATMRIERAGRSAVARDFVADFTDSLIKDRRAVSTPTRRGVLKLEYPIAGTAKTPSLVILCSFSIVYPAIKIRPNQSLSLIAADPYSVGAGVTGFVEAYDGRHWVQIFEHDFAPSATATIPDWQRFTIPLKEFAGKSVAIRFRAEKTGDQTAAWLALARAQIQ